MFYSFNEPCTFLTPANKLPLLQYNYLFEVVDKNSKEPPEIALQIIKYIILCRLVISLLNMFKIVFTDIVDHLPSLVGESVLAGPQHSFTAALPGWAGLC